MTALGFDPWAVLKTAKQGYPPAKPAKPANPRPAAPDGLAGLATLAGEGGPQRESQDRAASLLRAAEDALAALAGPELGPVLQVEQLDHDDAERAALVEHYAEPEAVAPAGPGPLYCFPCGRPVLLHDRVWSEARGWCCATCCPAVARAAR